MSILIVSATKMEIQPFLDVHPDAEILITGVGMPSTIYQLMMACFKKKYSAIIQVGLGGTFGDELKLGEAVTVERDCFADIGIWENEKIISVFDMGLCDPELPPFENGWLINRNLHQIETTAPQVKAVTVNLLTDNPVYIEQMKLKYGAKVESMEGAALHFICLQNEIPFLQIRGISNRIGERDKSKWKIEEAVRASNDLLSEIYLSFKH